MRIPTYRYKISFRKSQTDSLSYKMRKYFTIYVPTYLYECLPMIIIFTKKVFQPFCARAILFATSTVELRTSVRFTDGASFSKLRPRFFASSFGKKMKKLATYHTYFFYSDYLRYRHQCSHVFPLHLLRVRRE